MEKRYLSRAREREETNERKLKIPSTFEAVTWFVYDVHTQDWRMEKNTIVEFQGAFEVLYTKGQLIL